MRISLRLYRWLLKLYPAGFRETYGGPLQRDFMDEYANVRGAGDLVRFWARTLLDFARALPGQIAEEFRQDARHTLRLWRQRPMPTVFTVAVLAVAIGATTGVFSVLNALLLRSLPFHEPDRLASLHMFMPPGNTDGPGSTPFHAWRQQSGYLQDAASFVTSEVTIDGSKDAQRVRLAETSWNFFALLGGQPAPGRAFAPGEDTPGQTAVAVIGHGLWGQLFGEDPRAVGAVIRVNGAPFTIIGVAPAGFDYPRQTQFWTPTSFDWQRIPKAGPIFWTTIGRLRPELTWTQARRAFETEAYQRSPDRRTADAANRPALIPLQEQLAGPVKKASLLLLGGVALLLLLACANVANLLLSRTAARASELMIRTVLGASRARLTQQLLTEALLLSAVATLVGLFVAVWTAGVAAAAQPAQLSSQSYTILDWRVLGFAIALAFATGIVFGVGPALYAGRIDLGAPGRTATASPRGTRTRKALIAAQIAATIVLLTGSVALGRGFLALLHVDNGYETRSIATMSVSFAGTAYETADRSQTYYGDVVRRVREVPGVVSVSATESLPLNVDSFMGNHFSVDKVDPSAPMATVTLVAPAFFSTMGSRVLYGREFSPEDLRSTEALAMISEELARTFGDPAAVVGRSLVSQRGKPRRIIGVVRGLRYGGPTSTTDPQVFWLSRSPRTLTIVAKVTGQARDRIAVIRDAVQSIDPKVAVFNVKSMDERLDEALARPKFYATAIVFFGGLGLLLAVIGVYGVVSYAVAQRTREMGIRLALGTTAGRLRALVMRETCATVGLGVGPGVGLAIAAGRSGNSLIVGADSFLIGTVIAAMIITTTVAAVATWSATNPIARLDILDVIRSESGE
jgi:putative ABC transport system permease protein